VGRFVEQIQVMKSLWSESRTTFKGRHYDLDDVPMEPKPIQRPHPGLWFGGSHPQALRRAVAFGDGWMGAGASTVAEFKSSVAIIRDSLGEAGRDPANFCVSKRVYVAVEGREGRARRRLEDWFRLYYHDADIAARVAVWGDADRVAERLEELVTAGATDLVVNPVFDELATATALAPIIGRIAPGRCGGY
jgi:alkanesulfonate monooxygenase SsuD/methylene tetrahydromethanopterin reductase-like flavin-dependent oxidoreductase (luciferase family)